MRYTMYETLKLCHECKDTNSKIDMLRRHDSYALRVILKFALDPTVKWALPEGVPPYTPSSVLDNASLLIQECRKFQKFLDPSCGGMAGLHQIKREKLWIEFIEAIDPNDAILMNLVKDKKLPFNTITPKLVNKAFPDLLPFHLIVDVDENFEVVVEGGRKNQGFGAETPEMRAARLKKSMDTRQANKAIRDAAKLEALKNPVPVPVIETSIEPKVTSAAVRKNMEKKAKAAILDNNLSTQKSYIKAE